MNLITPEEHYFNKLMDTIYKRLGLDCRSYKVCYLKRRVAVRMRATRCQNYCEYEKLLGREPREYDLLLDRLTINVSQFFRDPKVFQRIKQLVLPELANRGTIRIWSAGCANGEEPYSLAILMREQMPSKCNWEIWATDLDPTCLAFAQRGIYKEQAIVGVTPYLRRLYFERQENGWQIIPELKRFVIFRKHDLTGQLPSDHFDLIVCRNVLIYFMANLQEQLFKGFHRLLQPNGFMVLGKTETLMGELREWYQTLDIRERIYRCRAGLREGRSG